MTVGTQVTPVHPAIGERFEDWLQRWATSEGRALFASRAAALHCRLDKESAVRTRKAASSFERLRAGKQDAVAQTSVANWRRFGELSDGYRLINSVFALGSVARSEGAVAKRREGDAVHLMAEPAFSRKHHIGAFDAAAAVRLPLPSFAPEKPPRTA